MKISVHGFCLSFFCMFFVHLITVEGTSRVGTPVVYYAFSRSQCLSGAILDSISSNYIGYLPVIKPSSMCLTGNGVANYNSTQPSAAIMSSSSSFASLSSKSIISTTLDAWISPYSSSTTGGKQLVILSIASTSSSSYDFQVFQLDQTIGCVMRNVNTFGASYATLTANLPSTTSTAAFHLTLTSKLSGTTTRHKLYINGTQKAVMTVDDSRSTFLQSSSHLYLFSEPQALSPSQPAWQGRIYHTALYNRSLSATEVLQNYQAKTSNSLPVSYNATVSIQENGEVGTHYDNPSYYLSPVPVLELANITLKALDGDEDASSPNYNAQASHLKVYLSSLPSKGTLYYLNGTAISAVPALIPSSASKTIKYRPLWQETSWPEVYTSFSFYATDGVTGGKGNVAVVSVKVTACTYTFSPTLSPSQSPSITPTNQPTTLRPSQAPTLRPTNQPTSVTVAPTTLAPTMLPSVLPTHKPTSTPSAGPSLPPSTSPSHGPSIQPSSVPTHGPSIYPTVPPSASPFMTPTSYSSNQPTPLPTFQPYFTPTILSSVSSSAPPTSQPSDVPTGQPTISPAGRFMTSAQTPTPSRVGTPVVYYAFSRSQCLSGAILDSISSNYIGYLPVIKPSSMCLTGNGVANYNSTQPSAAIMSSSSSFASLSSKSITSTTLDAWISPYSSSTTGGKQLVILSIASTSSSSYDFQVFQLDQTIGCVMRNVNTFGASYATLTANLPSTTSTAAFHLTLTSKLSGTTTRHKLYINGTQKAVMTVDDSRSTFLQSSSHLYLFSEPQALSPSQPAWQGRIYHTALYNRTLSATEVLQNYQAKTSNSLPVSYNATVSIQENGEVGTHYDNPSYYLSPVPVLELANITLKALDGDEDASSPNYNAQASHLKVYLSSLPSKGTLYYLNGTAISAVPALVPSSANKTIKYRPLWQETSWPEVYTSFSFYATDGVTGGKGNVAVVSVKVTACTYTFSPTLSPSQSPSITPTNQPTTLSPSQAPSIAPTYHPTNASAGQFTITSYQTPPSTVNSSAPSIGPTLAPTASTSYRVGTPVVYYAFSRSQCLSGAILDSISSKYIGYLPVIKPSSMCLTGNGVANYNSTQPSAAIMSSSSSFASLSSKSITSTTLDAWISPYSSSTTGGKQLVILSIASTSSSSYDFQVFQLDQTIGCVMRNVNTFGASYATLTANLPSTTSTAAFHLTLTSKLSGTTTRHKLYINGTQKAVMTVDDSRSTFLQSSSHLYLFSEPQALSPSQPAWQGRIYHTALYNRTLSATEVLQNYQAKTSNSLPVSYNVTATIQENGEVGTHYDNPSYYLSPVPVLELANITLKALDGDEDVSSPNYDAVASTPHLYLSSLPSKGTLYYLNGTAISAVPALIPSSANKTIKYRPLWQETSWPHVYANFSFYPIDGVTGEKGKSATVSVKVQATHQMPQATSTTLQAQAGRFQVVSLNATVKDGATIQSTYISSLPRHGKLYQVHKANGSIAQSSPISTIPAKLWDPLVAYIYTGPQNFSLNSVTGQMTTDSFRFRVEDSLEAQSLSSSVNVVVITSLEAITASAASASSRALQGMKTSLTIYAHDHQSLAHRHLCFQIMTLPSHGVLMQASSAGGHMISVGDVVKKQQASYPYSKGGSVLYQSVGDYFNSPSTTWNGSGLTIPGESFSFRAIDCNASNVVSLPVKQRVIVVNVNDPTLVEPPSSENNTLSVNALGSLGVLDTSQGQQEVIKDVVELKGWKIKDPDRDLDPVVAKLWATHGIVRLNPNHLNYADFTSIRYCRSKGADDGVNQQTTDDEAQTCQGSGEDKSMTFVTSPSELGRLLEGMEYRCIKPNVIDTIHLTIYDGQGGNYCLPNSAFTTPSNRSQGCYIKTTNFTINVGPSALLLSLEVSYNYGDLPGSLYFAAIALAAFFGIGFLTICCRRATYRFIRMWQQHYHSRGRSEVVPLS